MPAGARLAQVFAIPGPGWRPSPLWATRWVAAYAAMFLMAVSAGLVLYGTPHPALFGPAWQGTSDARQSASAGRPGMFLLTVDGVPHIDPETGLAVERHQEWGGNDHDRNYVNAWNEQMRARLAAVRVPRRIDACDTDGTSILRRLDARAADVIHLDVAERHGMGITDVPVLVAGGIRAFISCPWSCMAPNTIRIRDREVAYPGDAHLWKLQTADGVTHRGMRRRAWIPYCRSYRALLSDDGRQLWLAGPARTDDERSASWTATIDVATATTVGVDYVEGR